MKFSTHRFLDKLDKAILKGYSRIFLYGKGIDDYFLFNFHLGIREIQKTLFLYFYYYKNVEIFAVINNNKIIFYDKNSKKISIDEALKVKREVSGFGINIKEDINENNNKNNEGTKEIDEEQLNKVTKSHQERTLENDLEEIAKIYNERKIAVFVDEFEWQAGLYSSDKKLEMIRKILNWGKTKNSYIVISMKQPKLLEEFGFDYDQNAPNLIYVGNPSQTELKKAFQRFLYVNYYSEIKVDLIVLEDIVTSIQGSKKNLREAIRVFKNILQNKKDHNEKKIIKTDFNNVIDKPIEEKINFDDVVLNTETKNKIFNYIQQFVYGDQNSLKGFIFEGPPGTGKTYIVKAIASEFNLNFMSPTLAELKGEFVGQSSSKVKRLFEEARANSPTIIFIDEIDTVFAERGGLQTDSYVNDMVNQFLVEIDGAKTGKQKIFVIGSTNRLEVIDVAIRSRLSETIKIPLPDVKNREEIFIRKIRKKYNNFDLVSQEWKEEFIRRTEGMSGRDIDNFVKKLISLKKDSISKSDFDYMLENFEVQFTNDFARDFQNSIEIIKNSDFTFEEIIVQEEIKNVLINEINYILSSDEKKEEMKRLNILPKRGTILYGPPGNGKTTFVKALAGEYDFYLIRIISKNFTSYSEAETQKKIELIFSNTLKLSKMTNKKGVVLFFDEIETLIGHLSFKIRGTILPLLEDKNGIKKENSKVILIGATNFFEALDEASIREGRFDNKLKIDNPNDEEAIKILKRIFELDNTLDLSGISHNFYKNLLERKKEEKEKNIIKKKKENEEFEIRLSVVELKNIKEHEKITCYYECGLNNDNKIKITSEII